MLNFQVACAQKFQNRNDSFLRWSANMECYLSVKILEKMTRSKYDARTQKIQYFPLCAVLKCIIVFALSLCLIVCLIYARAHCCMRSAH